MNGLQGNGQQVTAQQVIQGHATQGVANPVVNSLAQTTSPNNLANATEQLFTQAQVNDIVSSRVNGLNEKLTTLTNQIAQLTNQSNTYLTELTAYKQRDILAQNGVPAKFNDFVAFEASKLAVNGKTFEDGVKEFVTGNQELFSTNISATVQTPTTSSVSQQVTGYNPAIPVVQPFVVPTEQTVSSNTGNTITGTGVTTPANTVQTQSYATGFATVAPTQNVLAGDLAIEKVLRNKGY